MEVNTELSLDKLIAFLEFVADKGLMKTKTVSSYKLACNIVLKILDEKEANDLSKIDIEAVFLRHRNLAAGKISPATLKTYEMRTRAAINAFIEYKKDPSSWKPGIKTRTTKAKPIQVSEKAKIKEQNGKPEEIVDEEEKLKYPSIHIDLQIHISPEAKPEQIDKIFASMREHLYPKHNN